MILMKQKVIDHNHFLHFFYEKRRLYKFPIKTKLFLSIVLITVLFYSCENYVSNIDLPSNVIEDSDLNNQSQLKYLINGVKIQYAQTQDRLYVLVDALSDAFVYAKGTPDAKFIDFDKIDQGDLGFPYDNTSVEIVFADLGELRFLADDLIRRVNIIVITDTLEYFDLKIEALFTGYLYGGIARYFYATYFGLNATEGGGIIDNGPFIPSDQMYDLAIERFLSSLEYTDHDYENQLVLTSEDHAIRVVNSLIARCYLYKGIYDSATFYASNGMIPGDLPFQSLYFIGAERNNYWWQEAGINQAQFVVADRFEQYYNHPEANRVKLKENSESLDSHGNPDMFIQNMYQDEDSPITHISWQENHLIRAECILRSYDGGDAMELINEVRSSHNISPLTINSSNSDSLLTEILYIERDKELFTTGARLPDQRRFNTWHLNQNSWQYLPITQRERNSNPNID